MGIVFTVLGYSEQKEWHADIQYTCSAPQWQCMSAYSSSHSNTAGAFQAGVVWPPSLKPCSRPEWL
jgi:hypothetical protein